MDPWRTGLFQHVIQTLDLRAGEFGALHFSLHIIHEQCVWYGRHITPLKEATAIYNKRVYLVWNNVWLGGTSWSIWPGFPRGTLPRASHSAHQLIFFFLHYILVPSLHQVKGTHVPGYPCGVKENGAYSTSCTSFIASRASYGCALLMMDTCYGCSDWSAATQPYVTCCTEVHQSVQTR